MDMKQLPEWTNLSMPLSAADLQYEVVEGLDNLALISFHMRSDDLSLFVEQLGFTKPLRTRYNPFPSQMDESPKWWNPHSLPEFVGGTVLNSGLCRELVVSRTNKDMLTVFLRTYEVG